MMTTFNKTEIPFNREFDMCIEKKIFDYTEKYLNNELSILLERFLKTNNKTSRRLLKEKITEIENDLTKIKQQKLKMCC